MPGPPRLIAALPLRRSSLYYWAQYDFFNNSLSGDRVPGTACDELIPSWRASRGSLRSPTNTLVYRGVGPGGVSSVADRFVRCTYRFVTDPRLYARVEVSVHRIKFRVSRPLRGPNRTNLIVKYLLPAYFEHIL